MVIDFHTHIFPDKLAPSAVASLAEASAIRPHTDGTLSGLLSHMDAAGVTLSVNLPVLTHPRQFESVSRFAAALNTAPTRERVISFAGMHPAMQDMEQRLHELHARGFRGIKIHPDYQDTFIDDEAYVRMLAVAKSLDLITVTHAGQDDAYIGREIKCTPTRVLRLLDRLGGYPKLVLAHLGANAQRAQVIDTLAGADVYFDTAYSLREGGQQALRRLLDRHGDTRILFATDSPWRDMREELDRLRRYIGDDTTAYQRITAGNACALLGL